jgi:hypothetical protein
MSDTPHEDDLVDADEAAATLQVEPDRVAVMVDQGLLTPVDGRFRRSEVEALRMQGG